MSSVLIRNLPGETLEALKARAARNRRSLQQELLSILDTVVAEDRARRPADLAEEIRLRLRNSGRVFSDSAELVREDRGR